MFSSNNNNTEIDMDETYMKYGQCRCCMANGQHRDVNMEYYYNNIKEVYRDLFAECFNLLLSPHNQISPLICDSCVHRLREASTFRMMVASNEEQLLKDVIIKSEPEKDNLFFDAQNFVTDVKIETDSEPNMVSEPDVFQEDLDDSTDNEPRNEDVLMNDEVWVDDEEVITDGEEETRVEQTNDRFVNDKERTSPEALVNGNRQVNEYERSNDDDWRDAYDQMNDDDDWSTDTDNELVIDEDESSGTDEFLTDEDLDDCGSIFSSTITRSSTSAVDDEPSKLVKGEKRLLSRTAPVRLLPKRRHLAKMHPEFDEHLKKLEYKLVKPESLEWFFKTPETKVPEVTAPEIYVPEVTAPEIYVPEVTALEINVPEVTALEINVPEVTAPEIYVPEVTAPEIYVPEVTALEINVPEITAPVIYVLEVTAPEIYVPEVTTLEINVPEVTALEINVPEVTAPEIKVPEVTAPEIKVPEVIAPEVKVPEVTAPEIIVPEVIAPEIKVPKVKAPKMKVPKLKAPKMKVPKVKGPEIKVPEVIAPELKLPEVIAPEIKVPEVIAPELKLPEVKIPEVKVPEVIAPEIKPPKRKAPERKETKTKRVYNKRSREEKLALAANATTIFQFSTATAFKTKMRNGYPCFYCREVYNFTRLRAHQVARHPGSTLYEHISKYSADEFVMYAEITDLKCTICEKGMKDLKELRTHLSEVHGKRMPKVADRIIPFKLEEMDFECQVCGQFFETFGAVEKHMNVHYGSFMCHDCGTAFITKHRLAVHSYSSHKDAKVVCELCNQTFRTQMKLRIHFEGVHKSKRTVKCTKCPEKFIDHFTRQKHLADVHGEATKRYSCNECDKAFSRRFSLGVHIRRCHIVQRIFNCERCTYECLTQYELRDHMLIHTGQTLKFECPVCKKVYNRKRSIAMHLKVHKNVLNNPVDLDSLVVEVPNDPDPNVFDPNAPME